MQMANLYPPMGQSCRETVFGLRTVATKQTYLPPTPTNTFILGISLRGRFTSPSVIVSKPTAKAIRAKRLLNRKKGLPPATKAFKTARLA
jgi:hypothetical protein